MELKDIEIGNFSDMAMGVTRLEDKVVFVEGALPGEVCDVEVIKDKKKYLIGKALNIKMESPLRIKSICPNFGICGGCDLMHISFEHENQYKLNWFKESFQKFLGSEAYDLNSLDIVSGNDLNYRNKVSFKGSRNDLGSYFGFMMKNSKKVVNIKECHIIFPDALLVKDLFEKTVNEFNKINNLQDNDRIYIKELNIWNNEVENLVQIKVFKNKKFNEFKDLYLEYMEKHEYADLKICDVSYTIGDYEKEDEGLEKNILMPIGDHDYLVGPNSFIQVNREIAHTMYDYLLELGKKSKLQFLNDLYCGVGTIGIHLSKEFTGVFSIDIVREAVELGKSNSAINEVSNILFSNGKVEDVFSKDKSQFIEDSLFIVDPPRKGLDKNLVDFLMEKNMKELIYVSCDKNTLFRDLGYFLDGGYEIQEIKLFNMFPRTLHVETVCLLSKLRSR